MDERIYDALVDLKKSVDHNNELQVELRATVRGLIGALEDMGQAMTDLTETLSEDDD